MHSISKSDLRTHRRVVVDFSVRVSSESMATPTLGRAQDISRGGMSLYAPLELAIGEVIKVTFQPTHSRLRFTISGAVANRNGFRYGITFLRLTSKESAELDRVTAILHMTQH